MKNLFTSAIILLCCMLLFTVTVMQIFHCIQFEVQDVGKYEVRNFKANRQTFEDIATRLLEFYYEEQAKNSDLEYIGVEHITDHWELQCIMDSNSSKSDYITLRKMSRQEQEAYDVFIQSFYKSCVSSIRVSQGRVVFYGSDDYFVIYTENGETPKWLYSENDRYVFLFIDRLSPKWFQVIGKDYSYERLLHK